MSNQVTTLVSEQSLDAPALDQLFRDARTHNRWLNRPIDDDLLRALYDLTKLAPTSANSQPLRIVFVKTAEGKALLKPALAPANVEKTMTAPVTVIVAHDVEFYEKLPTLFPHADARSWFAHRPADELARIAQHGGTMQGAYLILAARALGLDCGPIGGFDNGMVDRAFLTNTTWRSNFLVNLGYGDPAGVFPRSPRLDFADACRID